MRLSKNGTPTPTRVHRRSRHTIGLGVDDEDRKDTWLEDAESVRDDLERGQLCRLPV